MVRELNVYAAADGVLTVSQKEADLLDDFLAGATPAYAVPDAEDLPFVDASFDIVLSTFGVMFTPKQEQAAAELMRVCKPGGKIGLANWTG